MSEKRRLPNFDPAVYAKITLNELLMYAVHYLAQQGGEVASEDVVSICFTLFPKRFSLRKYPQWPDSAVVGRRWSDCRNKGYLMGNSAKGFKLTAKGIHFAEKVGQTLEGARPMRHAVPTEARTRAGRFVRSMETSDAFVQFKKYGLNAKVGEFDFRSLLLCTMESSHETLKRNLEQFKDYAGMYDRQDLLVFLNFCEDRFAPLLIAERKPIATSTRKKR